MNDNVRFTEAVIDIAINAGAMINAETILIVDSRELSEFIQESATRFEQQFNEATQDYLEEIDNWAERELSARYGIETTELKLCSGCNWKIEASENFTLIPASESLDGEDSYLCQACL